VKIASQRLPSSPPQNRWALPDCCGEKGRPFRITNLQISFSATALISHPYKTLGCRPSCRSIFATRCCALSANPLFPNACRLLFSLGSLFRTPFLCFQSLVASFRKYPGGGGTRATTILGCPPTISPRSPIPTKVGPMTSRFRCLCKPSSCSNRLQLRTSNSYSPKWSIIPAPESPARPRGRFV
jgi:hypothetical protein